jgi:hypothetical protein
MAEVKWTTLSLASFYLFIFKQKKRGGKQWKAHGFWASAAAYRAPRPSRNAV